MKKLLAPFILFTLTALLMSSCSGPSNMALTKRHYRSGYYVDWGTRKNVTTTPVITKTAAKNESKLSPINISRPENYTPANTAILIPEKSSITQITATPKHIDVVAAKKINIDLASQNTNLLNELAPDGINNVADHQDRENARVAFVVIVLCAIFIPPLGVGLMYGINSYFWIDLILTLLFFFPGMIFALIVVLM